MAKKLKKEKPPKYRFMLVRGHSLDEVFHVQVSKRMGYFLPILAFLILIVAIVSVIAFTSLREFIPGYPDTTMRRDIIKSAAKVDSLKYRMQIYDIYFNNINNILSGKELDNMEGVQNVNSLYNDITLETTAEDSLLRAHVDEEEKYSFTIDNSSTDISSLSHIHFFSPVNGIVSNKFSNSISHYGVDVLTSNNDVVKATLGGTIILSTWTLETGNIIQIQHDNNLISIYKHNSELLKSQGDIIMAGEPIAIVGNSGELSTGPHLHFELWHKGVPLNPEDYITF